MNAHAFMQDFQAEHEVDEIRDVSDAAILAAFNSGRRDIEIDLEQVVEISGGDLAQLGIDFD